MSAKNKEKHNKMSEREKKSAMHIPWLYSIQNIKEKLEVYNYIYVW